MEAPRHWTLPATSAARAADRPDHTAIICEDRRTSYARLHLDTDRAAHALRAAGVRPGGRVAFLGRESEYFYLAILACAKAGAVLIPVNWRLTAAEVDHILGDSNAELLFVETEFRPVVERVAPGLPDLRHVVTVDRPGDPDPGAGMRAWWAGAPDTEPLGPAARPDDAVVQIYTSGTTGRPKGVVLAHRSFFTLPAASRDSGVDWIDWRPDDISLISLPGFGIAGLAWFMHGINAGATNVVMRTYIAQEAVRLTAQLGVTTTYAAPAQLQMMLEEHGVTKATFASLRKVAYGGAPISESLLARCIEVLGCDLAQIYASTETGTVVVCLPPADHVVGGPRLRAAGRACPGTGVKVVDEARRPVPAGTIGQVCVRTPARMLGYWHLPEATAGAIDGDWLLMGDVGYLDDDGYLYLCDRISDTIVVAGQNVYPAEVERVLAEHPAVADSAVVGLPHQDWGEAVHACVTFRPGTRATPRELLLFLRGQVAGYKIPVAFHAVDELARNPAGKILRREVRQRLRAATADPVR
ncbi:long-chain-fatty-acid--CoA ligase [Streptomyces sp. SL13]|uniref:Long-chain-fatty-acid--CoA ligase n=1 Tax=Streptantibioticus silvisoli TaxID=2705255 RepID=A0AA90H0H7_9ACTN|nr:long-chain-fatty-acid--CoA ligase [Streptantibioticus silvisoli]MDI5969121.1 long-chain-fatty-acid--CoA ligase [Streptantibioticus silvisoli]